LKPKVLLSLVVGSAALTLVTVMGAADTAHATFNPTLEVTIADPAGGVSSNLTIDFNLPAGDVNFAGLVAFIPAEWQITPGEEIPIGAVVGELTAQATLGLINGACNNALPVEFIMLNSSIDPSDTVDFLDSDDNGTEDYLEDVDDSGLPDGFEKYPTFITRVLDDEPGDKVGQPLTPISRTAGITIVAGVNVLLQFLVFEPGTFINENIPNDEELGFPTVSLLQNIGDPESDPVPSAITDFCTPLTTKNITFGISKDNGCTAAVSEDELDPLCDVTGVVLNDCDDSRDNDGDQTVNDGCPTVGDQGETACEDDADDDGDGWVNDGCPSIVRVEAPPGSGEFKIEPGSEEDAEDSTPTEPDERGLVLSANPAEGTYTFTTIVAGQRDNDGDGFENALDVCPFAVNEGDPRVQGDGDSDGDGLDAACDPNDQLINSDEDLDGFLNRQDNCPLVANGEEQDNQRDTDNDSIGDACDPDPDDADAQGEIVIVAVSSDVRIGPGEPGTDTGGDGEDDDGGGSALIIIIIVVIAVVVVGGGGAFLYMRRGSGGGGGGGATA